MTDYFGYKRHIEKSNSGNFLPEGCKVPELGKDPVEVTHISYRQGIRKRYITDLQSMYGVLEHIPNGKLLDATIPVISDNSKAALFEKMVGGANFLTINGHLFQKVPDSDSHTRAFVEGIREGSFH